MTMSQGHAPSSERPRNGQHWRSARSSYWRLSGRRWPRSSYATTPSGAVVAIEVAVDRAEVRDGQTYIPYEVRNDGADAATDIVAIVEFTQGEQVIEETTVDIALLASHDVVEGEVVTTLDLAAHTVEARISALQIP